MEMVYLVVSLAITAAKAMAACANYVEIIALIKDKRGQVLRGMVLWNGISGGVCRHHCRQSGGCVCKLFWKLSL